MLEGKNPDQLLMMGLDEDGGDGGERASGANRRA